MAISAVIIKQILFTDQAQILSLIGDLRFSVDNSSVLTGGRFPASTSGARNCHYPKIAGGRFINVFLLVKNVSFTVSDLEIKFAFCQVKWTEFNRNAPSRILEKNELGVVLKSTSRKFSPVKNSKSRENNLNMKIVVKLSP